MQKDQCGTLGNYDRNGNKEAFRIYSSWHTFPTTGISSEIHIEVIGKLRGHNDLKQKRFNRIVWIM